MMITTYSREMYEAMDFFERNSKKIAYCSGTFEREEKTQWEKGYFYTNGNINNLFRLFIAGANYGWRIGYEDAEESMQN